MHVFVTGATGWVGSVVVDELVRAGHRVTGLVRSDEKAAILAAAGASALRGGLDDLDALRRGAGDADAVVHTAFDHDFSRFAASCEQDRRAIEALGAALEGSHRPLLVTSGLAHISPGRVATEDDAPPADGPFPRRSETAAGALAERGVRAAVVRLPPSVHGAGDRGFVPILIRLARETGVSAYLDEGRNRWAGVHRHDAGRVYALAVEQGVTERVYHAVADEGVAFKDLAAVIGRRLGVPVEPRGRDHFGWFASFAAADMAGSAARTSERLGWRPSGPGLLADVDQPAYFDR
jgi:nucleoside-diphosphate-sugar epimerase